jgi:hypothetical protein
MEILIDYDNVLPHMKKEGLVHLFTRIINSIAERKMHFPEKCRVRMYGGWYEKTSMTQLANELVAEIDDSFPNVVTWACPKEEGKSRVAAEIVKSLEVEPGRILFNTKRKRPFDEKTIVRPGAIENCNKTDCQMGVLVDFFKNRKCSEKSCYKTPGDILIKDEQKLVDTMITADLIHFAKIGSFDLAVVSSDDDLWPGMHTALMYGARVIQVHTRENHGSELTYAIGIKQYKHTFLK